MKEFENYHPIILLSFFVSVIFITMFTINPLIVVISFFCALSFCGILTGFVKLLKSLLYSLPIIVLIAVINPIFVHKGDTILFFLNDNPVTKEAILFGLFSAVMLVSIFYWCKCYNEVITSDKFIYLFGRIAPKISLVISMALCFIPKLKKQYKEINDVQKVLGIYSTNSFSDRVRSKFRIISSLITWSLENSVETADSMSARGYGLKNRTSYHNFKWTKRDSVMSFIYFVALLFIFYYIFSTPYFNYYPEIATINLSAFSVIIYTALFLFMFSPFLIELTAKVKWCYLLKSAIFDKGEECTWRF